MSEGGEHERRKKRTGKPSPLHNDPATLRHAMPRYLRYACPCEYVGILDSFPRSS